MPFLHMIKRQKKNNISTGITQIQTEKGEFIAMRFGIDDKGGQDL